MATTETASAEADALLDAHQRDKQADMHTQWTVQALADLIVNAVGLAAMQRPLEVERALASVFDLKQVRRQNQQMMADINAVARKAVEARHLVEAVMKDMDRLEERIDFLSEALERAERKQESGL